MAHTFTNLRTHIIFSPKDRLPVITADLKTRLFAYLGGIIRDLNGKAIIVGGTADHVHLLLSMTPTLSISETLRLLKANSSRWVNRERSTKQAFAWQSGYGAFSVSESSAAAVVKYIQSQEEHHKRVSFQEEFVAFLKKNGITYDERYLWE